MPLIEQALSEGAEYEGVSVPRVETWFCGDAGNDAIAAVHPAIKHVVMVGHANPELTRRAEELRELGKEVYLERYDTRRAAMSSFAVINKIHRMRQ